MMEPVLRLAGKRAVVTGASGGIGRAVAHAFAAAGATVMVNYRVSRAAAEQCVAEISAAGGTAYAFAADVSDAAACERLLNSALAIMGGLEIWANMAGADILTAQHADASDLEKLSRLIDTDLRGTVLASWAAAPVLAKYSGGSILNMSWDLALRGMAGRNPEMFAAVKAGVTGFTRALARSLAPTVRVNEIAPGWIETAFARDHMSAAYRAGIIAATPLQRLGRPDDVAQAAVFLVSDEAAFITGQTLNVDGGLAS